MTDDVYRIKADVSQYSSAIDKLVASHDKLLQAESAHATKLTAIEAAEKGATHSIQGITKAGLAFTSSFKAVNGLLEQTSAKLEVLKHKGGQTVAESIKRTALARATNVTTPQVVKIDKAVATLDELIAKNKFTKKQLEDVWQNIQLGISQKLTGDLAKVKAALTSISKITATKAVAAVKIEQPDISRAADAEEIAAAKALAATRVTIGNAAAAKLKATELKLSNEVVSIKEKTAAAIKAIDKQSRKDLRAVDNLKGVRAQAKNRKEISAKTAADIVKIATTKHAKLEGLLTKLDTARRTHNTSVLQAEKVFAEKMLDVHEDATARRQALIKKEKAAQAEANRATSDRELVTGLPVGKKATNKDVLGLVGAEGSLLKFLALNRKGAKEQIISAKRLKDTWDKVFDGSIRDIEIQNAEMATLVTKIDSVARAHSKANAAGGHSSNALIKRSHALTGELDKQKQKLLGVTLSWQSMFRLIVSQASSRLLSGFLAELTEARDIALELSINFARIQTLDGTNTPISAWSAGVRELSENSGLDILDQSKAAYEALSNQIGEGTTSMGFLEDANNLAIVSGASAAESGTLLADAIHAWGLEMEDSGTIAAKFFKIVDLGRATIAEMAPNLGRVSVPAAQLGVSMDEVGAAFAVTTLKGVELGTASTLVRNVLLKLAKPSEELQALMTKLGFSTGEAWIETRTFGGVLADLEKEAGGSSSAIAKLFPNIRSMTGATVFAGDGLNLYNNALKGISRATLDYDKNVEKVRESLGKTYEIATQKIENIFVFDTAQPMLQYVSDLTNEFEGLVTGVEVARAIFITLGTAAIPVVVLGIGQLIKATAGLALTLAGMTGPWGLILTAAATMYGGIVGFSAATSTDMARDNEKVFVEWLKQFDDIESRANGVYSKLVTEAKESFKLQLQPVRLYFQQMNIEANKVQAINKQILKDFNATVSEERRLALLGLNDNLTLSRQKIADLASGLDALKQQGTAVQASLSKSKLSTSLVGESDIRKILTLNKEIERLSGLRKKATSVKEFQGLTSQIDAAFSSKAAIELKLTANPEALEKAYDDAFDQLEARQRIFSDRGDEVGVQRTKKEYQELLDLYNKDVDLGLDSDYFNGIVSDIAAVKSELATADEGSNLFFNLQDELANLEQLKAGVSSVFQTERAGDSAAQFQKLKAQELEQQAKLAIAVEKQRAAEKASITSQQTEIAKLTAAFKGLTSFKVEDFKTTKKTEDSLKKQLEHVRAIQAVVGKGALAGVGQELKDRAAQQKETTKTTDKQTTVERLAKESETELAVANRVLKTHNEAVKKAGNVILDFATKLNVTPAETIRSVQDTIVNRENDAPALLKVFANIEAAMQEQSKVFAALLRGEVADPIGALSGFEAVEIKAKVDPEVLAAFNASTADLARISQIAKEAPTDLDASAELKKLLSGLELKDPKAEALRKTDPSTLDAGGRVKLADAISKLTIVEQLLIKLVQEDTVGSLEGARVTQEEGRTELKKLVDQQAAVKLEFTPVVTAQVKTTVAVQATTSAIGTLNSTLQGMAAEVPSLRVIPQRPPQDTPEPVQAGDTYHNTYNIATRDFDAAVVAKKLEPAMTRLQRLSQRGR